MPLNELDEKTSATCTCREDAIVPGTAEYIGSIAQRAMLGELDASPKPGLVDRYDSGAHTDMDYYLFVKSIGALGPYFVQCAASGLMFDGGDLEQLFFEIRKLGIEAEKTMFRVTNGVNTHKGQIFSLGLLTASVGVYLSTAPLPLQNTDLFSICTIASRMCNNSMKTDLRASLQKMEKDLTYGERLYRSFGISGIRGEAANGFQSVQINSYPLFKKLQKKNPQNLNQNMVNTLLFLQSVVEDSNLLGRGGFAALSFVRRLSLDALLLGGMNTDRGREFICKMNTILIDEHLSPGGSADLLAVTLFLYYIKHDSAFIGSLHNKIDTTTKEHFQKPPLTV